MQLVRTQQTLYQRPDMLKIESRREQVGGVIYGVIIMGVYFASKQCSIIRHDQS